jgi:hypothetical protein
MTKQPIIIASFANAYRVAVKQADATDQDQHVLATGDYTRPFIVACSHDARLPHVALITTGAR